MQKETRLLKVAQYYLEGHNQHEIGRKVGVATQTVSRDLKEVRARWRNEMIRDFGEAVARELAKLDKIEAEAWLAWRRTIGKHKITTEEEADKIAGEAMLRGSKVSVKTESLAGDPRFLEVALKCSAERRKLIGLDAPERLELYGGNDEHRGDIRSSLYQKLFAIVDAAGEDTSQGEDPGPN